MGKNNTSQEPVNVIIQFAEQIWSKKQMYIGT